METLQDFNWLFLGIQLAYVFLAWDIEGRDMVSKIIAKRFGLGINKDDDDE